MKDTCDVLGILAAMVVPDEVWSAIAILLVAIARALDFARYARRVRARKRRIGLRSRAT